MFREQQGATVAGAVWDRRAERRGGPQLTGGLQRLQRVTWEPLEG